MYLIEAVVSRIVQSDSWTFTASLPHLFYFLCRMISRKWGWYRDCFTFEYSKGNATEKERERKERVQIYRHV